MGSSYSMVVVANPKNTLGFTPTSTRGLVNAVIPGGSSTISITFSGRLVPEPVDPGNDPEKPFCPFQGPRRV